METITSLMSTSTRFDRARNPKTALFDEKATRNMQERAEEEEQPGKETRKRFLREKKRPRTLWHPRKRRTPARNRLKIK